MSDHPKPKPKPPTPPTKPSAENNAIEMTNQEIDDILFGLERTVFDDTKRQMIAEFSEQASPRAPKKERQRDSPRPRAEHLTQYPLKHHEGLQALLNAMTEEN